MNADSADTVLPVAVVTMKIAGGSLGGEMRPTIQFDNHATQGIPIIGNVADGRDALGQEAHKDEHPHVPFGRGLIAPQFTGVAFYFTAWPSHLIVYSLLDNN